MPTMYRWVSTSVTSSTDLGGSSGGGDDDGAMNCDEKGDGRRALVTFSVPVNALPGAGEGEMTPSATAASVPSPSPSASRLCAVAECQAVRKYRLVSDWEKGACGMQHLKLLEGFIA